jgi:Tfp pilus assembly protein PilE
MDVMVVTLIIGVLGSLGLNQYNTYIARAKRPEAVMTFRAIAAAQREYLLTHGRYAGTFEALGFNTERGVSISPTEVQGKTYNYRILQDDGPRSWYVIATGDLDGDPFPDIIAASNPR